MKTGPKPAQPRALWAPAVHIAAAGALIATLLAQNTGECEPPTSRSPEYIYKGGAGSPAIQTVAPALDADGRSPFGLGPGRNAGAGPNGEVPAASQDGSSSASGPQVGWDASAPPTPPPLLRFFQLPEERFRGIPEPLVRQSWGCRPFSLGAVFGFIEGGALIDDWVYQDNGVIGGFRVGWDHQNYWGLEMRFAWASLDTYNGWRAEQAAGYPNAQAIYPGGTNDMFFWDTNLLWYPTGDTRWRPYLAAGMGLATVDFADALGTEWSDTMFALPLSVGLKYRCTDRIALRLEAAENLVFGSRPIGFFEDLSVTGGVEWRFGGSRRAYWPWNPGRHYW